MHPYIALHCIALHCTALHCTALHCVTYIHTYNIHIPISISISIQYLYIMYILIGRFPLLPQVLKSKISGAIPTCGGGLGAGEAGDVGDVSACGG